MPLKQAFFFGRPNPDPDFRPENKLVGDVGAIFWDFLVGARFLS
jgi:hypothetical protein